MNKQVDQQHMEAERHKQDEDRKTVEKIQQLENTGYESEIKYKNELRDIFFDNRATTSTDIIDIIEYLKSLKSLKSRNAIPEDDIQNLISSLKQKQSAIKISKLSPAPPRTTQTLTSAAPPETLSTSQERELEAVAVVGGKYSKKTRHKRKTRKNLRKKYKNKSRKRKLKKHKKKSKTFKK